MIYIHTFHFPLNLEIISPEYECEGRKEGGQGGKCRVHTEPCLYPCHFGYSSIIGCVSLYCNYLFKSVYLSVASMNYEQ